MPGRVRPWMAMQQHHRLALAAMAHAQHHLSHVDMLEREAFEYEQLLPALPLGRTPFSRCPRRPPIRDLETATVTARLCNRPILHTVALALITAMRRAVLRGFARRRSSLARPARGRNR